MKIKSGNFVKLLICEIIASVVRISGIQIFTSVLAYFMILVVSHDQFVATH